MKNMRIWGSRANSLVAESINGHKLSVSLKRNYIAIIFISLFDRLFVISKDFVNQKGEVGYVDFDFASGTGTYTPLYANPELTLNFDKLGRGISIRETADRSRIYWWDYQAPPRTLNVSKYINLVNNPIAQPDLVIGKYYMVVRGHVSNGIGEYGDDFPETVFVADGFEVYDNGDEIVIPYYSIELVNFQGKANWNIPVFQERINGSLTTGTRYYFYQLCDDETNATPFSIPSNPIYIAPGIPNPVWKEWGNYQEYVGSENNSDISLNGVRLLFENIDINYKFLRIVCVKADGLGYFEPNTIAFIEVTGTTMTYDHVNDIAIDSFPIDNLITNLVAIEANKDGDAIYNQLILSNIMTAPDVKVDLSSATAQVIEHYMNADTSFQEGGNQPNYNNINVGGVGQDLFKSDTIPANGIEEDTTWKSLWPNIVYYVIGGNITLGPGSFPFASIPDGSYFKTNDYNTAYTKWVKDDPGQSVFVYPCIAIQAYDGKTKYYPVKNDYFDNKGMSITHHLRSHFRREVYRFALCLISKKMIPGYGHYLLDVTMPDLADSGSSTGFSETAVIESDYERTQLKNLGVRINNIDFNKVVDSLREIYDDPNIQLSDLDKYFDGFAIVRAKRKEQVLAQGLLWPLMKGEDANNDLNFLYQCGPNYMQDDYAQARFGGTYGITDLRAVNYFAFLTPEILYDIDNRSYFESNDILRIVHYLQPHRDKTDNQGMYHTRDDEWYTKMVDFTTPGSYTPYLQSKKIEKGIKRTEFNKDQFIDNYTLRSRSGILLYKSSGSLTTGYKPNVLISNTGIEILAGTVAPFMLVKVYDDEEYPSNGFGMTSFNGPRECLKPLVNYERPLASPYGGSSESDLAGNVYYSTGHYQRFDSDFISYLLDNAGICNGVDIYAGDCFVNLFDFTRLYHPYGQFDRYPDEDFDSGVTRARTYPTSQAVIFPVESKINLALRAGRHIAKDLVYNEISGGIHADGLSVGTLASPGKLEQFAYNAAYSQNQFMAWPIIAQPANYIPQRRLEKTHIISNKKNDGQLKDNWRVFTVNNMLEVEGRYGPIYACRVKNNRFYYWQEEAFGTVPVNERVTISNATGDPTTIGVQSSINRFDTIESDAGVQHTHGIAETDNGFLWIDARKQFMFKYDEGAKINPVSLVKLNQSFFNNLFGNYRTGERTLTGPGIFACSDKKYKEALFLIRDAVDQDGNKIPDFMIGYDYVSDQYSGYYETTIPPGLLHPHQKLLLLVPAFSNDWTGSNVKNDVTLFGNMFYFCIQDYTAGTLLPVPGDLPDYYQPMSDGLHCVYVGDRGDVGMFFGKVESSSVTVVVVPDKQDKSTAYVFENLNVNASNAQEYFDQLIFENSTQSVTENTDDPVNYRNVNNLWESSIPLDSDQSRFVDTFLKITMVNHNYDTSGLANVSLNKKVRLLSVKTFVNKFY